MKHLLITLLSFVMMSSAHAWTQRAPLPVAACQVHNPYGFAKSNTNATPICRQGYFVAYDAPAKIPRYVTYTLLPNNAIGCVARTDAFVADQSIVGGAVPADYVGTGYDKGHGVPDGDLSWDVQVEYESFLMTNMYPQAGSLNRGIWKLLETSVRGWAVQLNQPYTIYVGAIYGAGDKTIGNGVVVPHSYYKIVINQATGKVAAWAFPHVAPYPNLGNDLTKFRMPVANIQQASGIEFQFPVNADELAIGSEWPVDFGALTQKKRQLCKG